MVIENIFTTLQTASQTETDSELHSLRVQRRLPALALPQKLAAVTCLYSLRSKWVMLEAIATTQKMVCEVCEPDKYQDSKKSWRNEAASLYLMTQV